MKYKVDDIVYIKRLLHGHCFTINETVKIIKIYKDIDAYLVRRVSENSPRLSYYVKEDELHSNLKKILKKL